MGTASKTKPVAPGVNLPEGSSGSGFLHHILTEAVRAFPHELSAARLSPDPARFRARFGDELARFEAVRCASPRRTEIARCVVQGTQAGLVYRPRDASESRSFGDYLGGDGHAFSLERLRGRSSKGLAPQVPFAGRNYGAAELGELASLLVERGLMTQAAGDALAWIGDYALANAGRIELGGQRFALLGAAAELAPTRFLLEAGAEVLWLDLQSPSPEQLPGGELSYVSGGSDLLLDPLRCKQTLLEFADGEPLHLGLYAYAAGESQEWRLASTMNGIARSLPEGSLRSISLWISPTTPSQVRDGCVDLTERRRAQPPLWQSALRRSGMLSHGHERHQDVRTAKAVVSIQGVSYQAAQYVAKLLAAEVYALDGSSFEGERRPLTVSANVAGITRTRSLAHPLFEAAFEGAPAFGIEIFRPETTRALSTLLMLHDLLNPNAVANQRCLASGTAPPERARRLGEIQVHGGVYTNPHALEPSIRVAAVLGMTKRPTLARGLFGRS
ncbi:MAG: hypothetical protein R3B89_20285 [Polyangiaceae bacterium]